MVEVNCAAIPSELIESELFGHVKGSFTGAIKDKQGKFELANNGTIFLDEIGDMSLVAQAKVLRALQESKVSPVGSDKEIKVDVRVIAATNKDMKKEIEEGKFREDLYHRLSVIEIHVPALDDRKEDIPQLVEFFSKSISEEQNNTMKSFDSTALEALQNYNWSGNIRELRNVVERLIILGNNPVTMEDVQDFVRK
jgi:transcriptional regulator with GAF, ATPase, and Fis domain